MKPLTTAIRQIPIAGRFQKGQSGNPGGRSRVGAAIARMIREQTDDGVELVTMVLAIARGKHIGWFETDGTYCRGVLLGVARSGERWIALVMYRPTLEVREIDPLASCMAHGCASTEDVAERRRRWSPALAVLAK